MDSSRTWVVALSLCAAGVAACASSSSPGVDAGHDVTLDVRVDVGLEDVAHDAASDEGADAPPDAVDAGGCAIAGYGTCARGTSCVTGRCPDGSPVTCFCTADGRSLCTGACPPSDAGVTCGAATGMASPSDCAPTRLDLDPALCRCILGWVWNGTACVSLANCHCYGDCGALHPTRESCEARFTACLRDR